jgi:hypothetical protein
VIGPDPSSRSEPGGNDSDRAAVADRPIAGTMF